MTDDEYREHLIAERYRLREVCRWREGQVKRAIWALGHGDDCRCVVCVELWEPVPREYGGQV